MLEIRQFQASDVLGWHADIGISTGKGGDVRLLDAAVQDSDNPDNCPRTRSPGGTTVPAPGSAVPESGAPSHQLHPVCHSG